jgi:hypothetical protein
MATKKAPKPAPKPTGKCPECGQISPESEVKCLYCGADL